MPPVDRQCLAQREPEIADFLKQVQPLRVPPRFGRDFAGNVSEVHAVTGIALGVRHIERQASYGRHPVDHDANFSAPGVIDPLALKLWKKLVALLSKFVLISAKLFESLSEQQKS